MIKKFKMQITVIFVLFLLGTSHFNCFAMGSKKSIVNFTIGINQFMEHPLLDATYRGIMDVLKEKGLTEATNSKVILKNANGDINIAVQINKQFVDQKVNMIVALGTPSAQSACKLTQKIPVIFGAITDPVASGIVDSLQKPGGNKTGTSDRWPYEKQVGLIKEIVPTAKKVGIVLNPGESNTEASMKYIRPLLKQNAMIPVEVPVANTSEVLNAAKSLIGRCDVMLIPGDNTVIAAIGAMVRVANENKIPLFCGSTASVEKGGLATYGNNYYEIGKETGRIIANVLINGINPGDIPVSVATESDLIINLNAAKKQNIVIPDNLREKAKKIIK